MTPMCPRPLAIIQPCDGLVLEPISPGDIGVVLKLWGANTGGAVSMVEHPFPLERRGRPGPDD